MSRSLAAAPPSAFSTDRSRQPPVIMRSNTSRTSNAIASRVARARWARVVPRVMPAISPRASGSQSGAPRPVSAGTKTTPPESGTAVASASASAAVLITPSPSRSHCTAAPVTNTEPSSA